MTNNVVELLKQTVHLLYVNGQTTQRVVDDTKKLAYALGCSIELMPQWNVVFLSYTFDRNAKSAWQTEIIQSHPSGVDMNKVAKTSQLIDEICHHTGGLTEALIEQWHLKLKSIAQLQPSSHARFILMCGAGAAALGMIFGVSDVYSLTLIFISAALGAVTRRLIARQSTNLFIQPLVAAAVAGLVALFARRYFTGINLQLVELAPCMILVPGAHILNALLDLVRGRLTLGLARSFYAVLILFAISTGLIAVLSFGSGSIDLSVPIGQTTLAVDVLSAGVAVAAFGAFFSIPWRLLFVPVLVGMLCHASRWFLEDAGLSVEFATFFACLVAGCATTVLSKYLKLPFAALAFASVVSMMPGFFVFKFASALIDIFNAGGQATVGLISSSIAYFIAATLIVFLMALGLILPKMLFDGYYEKRKDA